MVSDSHRVGVGGQVFPLGLKGDVVVDDHVISCVTGDAGGALPAGELLAGGGGEAAGGQLVALAGRPLYVFHRAGAAVGGKVYGAGGRLFDGHFVVQLVDNASIGG